MGRLWHSAGELGLYLSAWLRTSRPIEEWTRWTIAAGWAGGAACLAVHSVPVVIEWPNDLMVGGRKLAGLLVETRTRALGGELFVGAGFNLGHTASDLPGELRTVATSFRLESIEAPPSRERVAAAFVERLFEAHALLDRGDWDTVRLRWEELAPRAYDAPVEVVGDGAAERGRTCGLDDHGALRVETPRGRRVVRWVDAVRWLDEVD